MDRGRDRRYDDRDRGSYGGGGGGYRRDERPRSRSHTRRRTPPPNEYRDRPRSPPRDYERPRSPYRRRSRSPYGRDRSPGRSRDGGPRYRERSPPRGQYSDERERYGRRDYPPREGPRKYPMENNYRPGERARSPPRSQHASHEQSPRSQPISRRNSLPPRERMRSPPREAAYDSRGDRGYHGRERSPHPVHARTSPREAPIYRERTPTREETYRERSPPRTQDDGSLPDAGYDKDVRGDYERDGRPPTGPAYRGEPVPQDGRPPRQESHRDSPRGGYHGSSSHRRDDTRNDHPPRYDDTPHSGRWPAERDARPRWEPRQTAPAFRGSSNSTATTYPRTQRFNTSLSGVTSVIEGGKKQPSLMDPEQQKRLQQLEEERKKLEAMIEEKQRKKRSDLREWDKLEREAKSSQFRSELAESHLQRLNDSGSASNVY